MSATEAAAAPIRIRFGIIGCANIARKVCRAINLAPTSVLYAIASRSLEKAKQFAQANGLPESIKIYGSYDQVLQDPFVDAVYVPLPTSLHLHWAVMAATNKKHVLIEKPTALDAAQLDLILEACQFNGVQFMDGSMWLHHPRTLKIKDLLLANSKLLGDVKYMYSTSTTLASPEFLENDIRVKAELDGLGALGDLGWYCLGAVLWAKNYQLPTLVTALPDVTKNSNGVILSCTASLQYGQPYTSAETIAIVHCSFLSNTSMDLNISGCGGSLNLRDFIIPYQENSASFEFTMGAKFVELHVGWNVKPQKVIVDSELPQEALMVEEFAKLVQAIKTSALDGPDPKWPDISRKTQMLVDAVKKSVDLGCKPVYF